MKSMKCSQLGGPENCNVTFSADTFDEISIKSKAHGMKMWQTEDEAHVQAMQAMKQLMHDEIAMQQWLDKKRAEFDALPEE